MEIRIRKYYKGDFIVEGIDKEKVYEIIQNLDFNEVAQNIYNNLNPAYYNLELQLNLTDGTVGLAHYRTGESEQVRDYITIYSFRIQGRELYDVTVEEIYEELQLDWPFIENQILWAYV